MAWPYSSYPTYPDLSNPYGSASFPPPGLPGLDPFSGSMYPGGGGPPGMNLPPMPGTSSYGPPSMTPPYMGSTAPAPYMGSGYSPYDTSPYPSSTAPYSSTYGTSSPYSTAPTPYSTYSGTSSFPSSPQPTYSSTTTSTYPSGTSTYPSSSGLYSTSSYSSSTTFGSSTPYSSATPGSGYSRYGASTSSSSYYPASDPYSLPSVSASYSLPTLNSTPSTYSLPTLSTAPAATTSPASTLNSYSLPSTTMPSYSLPSTTVSSSYSSYSLPSTTTPSYLTTPVSTYSTPSTSMPATSLTVTPSTGLAPTTNISPMQAQLLAQRSQQAQNTGSYSVPSNSPGTSTYGTQSPTTGTYGTQAPMTGTYGTQTPTSGTYGAQTPTTGTYGTQGPMTGNPSAGTPSPTSTNQSPAQMTEVERLRLEKLKLQQKENQRLEETLRKEREAQERLRIEMEQKRQEEARQKFLQLQQQKVEEEKRKREAQRKLEEQEKLALEKRQRELELKTQELEKIRTPVSSPPGPRPTTVASPPQAPTADALVTDTFFGSLIETSKLIASNCKRLSTIIMEQYDMVIQEGSAGRSLLLDLIAVVDGTLSRLISMLNNNVMNIQDNMHNSIRLAASNLNGTVQALISCVKNVSDVQKAGSITAEERTKQMRQHNIAVSYAIRNLVEELQKLKVAERADPHAAKLLSANSLEEAEEMSIAVTATQHAIDEVRIAQLPPRPTQAWAAPAKGSPRRLDTQTRIKISNTPVKKVDFTAAETAKIVKLQRRLKSWIVRRRMAHTLELMRGSDEMKQTHHRFRVLSEIMDTEASYMASLELCKKFFLDPLRAALNTKPILSAEEIRIIFSSMEMILGFTVQVKSHLEARMKQWPAVQKLGDIFKELAPAMKIYADYVNKFDAAVELYKECIQSKTVNDFLRECMTRANTRLDLPSFLIMPVQRMPRYQMLLKELLKFTPPTHVDCQNLKEAADAVTEVNVYINRKKQEQDNRLKIVALQEMIKSAVPLVLIAPHRLFVRQGPLLVKRNNEPSSTACVVFMFSDLLIITTQLKSTDGKSLSFNYVDKLSFTKADFNDLGSTDFKITEDKKVIVFTASSPEEQRGWVKELKETIETVKLHSQLNEDISDTNNFKEGFVLLSATYGQLHKPRYCIDVTNALQSVIKEQGGSSLTLNADTKCKLPGFSDPSKSKLKSGSSTRKKNSLMIVFSANGQVRTKTFADADPVNLDANTP